MKKVYIETSVVSYYTSNTSHDIVIAGHQASTKDFWLRLNIDFLPFVSVLVNNEISQGNAEMIERRVNAIKGFNFVHSSKEAERLAERLVIENAIPKKYPEDALHIAIATTLASPEELLEG